MVERAKVEWLELPCSVGLSGQRKVAIGFALATDLYHASFADVLDEATGRGYQRRFNARHSLDFRRYVQGPDGTSTPLVFNLRASSTHDWTLREGHDGSAVLCVPRYGDMLAQVDCQHRLGHLSDVVLSLPFMVYLGLCEREELELFSTINSKAKGLNGSLLQFHEATLTKDAAEQRPELIIALELVHEPTSPWFGRVDLGGKNTSGMQRRASLTTLQKAIRKFLSRSGFLKDHSLTDAVGTVLAFWRAVAVVLPEAWSDPRKHVLTKEIGVYALMEVAADIYAERGRCPLATEAFSEALADFALDFDWSNEGPLKGFGGQAGATQAAALIRSVREPSRVRLVANG